MKKMTLILILLCTVAGYTCRAQSAGSTPENIVDHFFQVYGKAGLKTGLDTLFAYGDKDVIKALPYIKDTLSGTVRSAGNKYYGYELITKKSITASYAFYSYLVKCPDRPLRFNFIFYKPDSKWVIVDFSFDSNISAEAAEFGRLR